MRFVRQCVLLTAAACWQPHATDVGVHTDGDVAQDTSGGGRPRDDVGGIDTHDGIPLPADTFRGANSCPVGNAGFDTSGTVGTLVVLDAGGSVDADADTLTFQWTLVARPPGSEATLANADQAVASILPDAAGLYTVSLQVADGGCAAPPDVVIIVVREP